MFAKSAIATDVRSKDVRYGMMSEVSDARRRYDCLKGRFKRGTIQFAGLRSILTAWAGAGLVESGRQKLLVRDPHGLVMLADGLRPDLL